MEGHEAGQEGLRGPSEALDSEWDDLQESDDLDVVDGPEELPDFSEDEYVIVFPGGDIEVAQALPKPRRLQKALVLHEGCLTVCDGKRRTTLRTPTSTVDDPEIPIATRIVMVFIDHRAVPPRSRSRRYLIVTDDSEDLLGWIDHSPPGWDFQVSMMRALAQSAGLECSTERFGVETEFELAHEGWVR